MFHNIAPAVVITLMTMSPAAAAWHPDKSGICSDMADTVGISHCLGARAKVWDARLNQAYKALMAVLSAESDTTQLADLKKAQRLWLQYREANCRYDADEPGTISQIIGPDCMRQMTQDRAIELQQAWTGGG